MDLTVKIEDTFLNIRVAIIMQTERGFVIQKHAGGYYFFLGGRIKIGETSLQGAIRETEEEAGLKIDEKDFKFVSVIENFFSTPEGKTQEICFVYSCNNQEKINPEFGLLEFPVSELENLDIRPEIIKKIILENKFSEISHFVVS